MMDYNADRFLSTGKMSPVGRGKRATQIRKTIAKKAAQQAALKKRRKESEAAKKLGGSRRTNEAKTERMKKKTQQKVIKKHQMKKAKKAGLILADVDTEEIEETEAGSMSDDAIERAKENDRKKKKMLEEAGKA